MSKTKKAQGLSLNMIVVGAIGLVVLVVIITIFVSSAQKSQKDIDEKQKGSLCNDTLFSGSNDIGAAITYPSNCTMAGGEILIGKYYGKLSELEKNGKGWKATPVGTTEVDADGMSYVCCKYEKS
jgi:hypothetical protein